MVLKHDLEIDDKTISKRIQSLINQTYKLLPTREQGQDWEKPLQTIIEELSGVYRLMNCGYSEVFLPLLSKMEGLYTLVDQKDFLCYRRTIFECLGLMNILQKELCH